MNTPIDVQGVWWLPETPEHKVPGWLRYDFEDGGELRLAGSLRAPDWVVNPLPSGEVQRSIDEPPRDKRVYPRIHGQSGDQLFNLEDSFQTSIQRHLCREDDSAERIHVNWFLTGAWFDQGEKPEFDNAVVHLQHLTDWVNHTGLEPDYFRSEPGAPFAIARANTLERFCAPAGEDCELVLWQELSTGGDGRNDLILNQQWTLTIKFPTLQPLSNFTDRVSDLQDLLTIASGRVGNIEDFHFHHRDVPALSLAGTPMGSAKEKLGFYTRWSNRDDNSNERLSPYGMLFTFDDLGGIDGVERWMRFAGRHRSELSRVMATRYNQAMFLEDRVSNCVAALESFDRTRRNAPDGTAPLVERLRQCAAFAGDSFLVLLGGEDVAAWTERAKTHRHTLGHHLDAFRNDTAIVERELADQLLWLALLCFLREAGAPRDVFLQIGKHSQFQRMAGRAKARIESGES
jgi:hypothetical protein